LLSVDLLNLIMLSIVILLVVMLGVIFLSFVMLRAFNLSFVGGKGCTTTCQASLKQATLTLVRCRSDKLESLVFF